MDPNFDSFGFEYPCQYTRKPTLWDFRIRGYGLHPRGPNPPCGHRSSAVLEYEEFHLQNVYQNSLPDYQFPPANDQIPQTDYRYMQTDYRFMPSDYQSPSPYDRYPSNNYRISPVMNTSNNWNSSPVTPNHPSPILMNRQRFLRFRRRSNSIERTPGPDAQRRRRWLFDHTHAVSRGQYCRRGVKRLNNARQQSFHAKIQIPLPRREVRENCSPYPLKELQAARNILINELFSEQGGIRLLRVRKAVGMFKNLSAEKETRGTSYDQQAAFLLTVPLPTPSNDVHVTTI